MLPRRTTPAPRTGANLAYQVSGEGPLDLLFLHGAAIPIDFLSDDPGLIRVRRRLGTFSRTVRFDRRGQLWWPLGCYRFCPTSMVCVRR